MYVTSYQNRSERVAKKQVHILQKSKGRLDFGLFLFGVFFLVTVVINTRTQQTFSEQFTTMIYLVIFI